MTYNEFEIICEAFEIGKIIEEALNDFSTQLREYRDDESFLFTFNYEVDFNDKSRLLCEWSLEYFQKSKGWLLIDTDTHLVYQGESKEKRITIDCYDEVQSVAVDCMDYIISYPDDPWYEGTFNKNIY